MVEFTGIAGIGKTTIVKQVSNKLEEQNIINFDLSSSKKKVKFHENFSIECFRDVLLLRPKNLTGLLKNYRVLNSYFNKISRYMDILDGVVLLDEGIFHKIREIQRNSEDTSCIKVLDSINSHVQFPDYVIVLEADAETIYNRRFKRSRHRDNFNYEMIVKYVGDFSETLKMIEYSQKKYNSSMRIIKIKYNDYILPEQAADIIIGEILETVENT